MTGIPVTVRRWVYGVAIVALPLLVRYGVMSHEDVPLWAAMAAAVLVPGLALAHTDDPPEQEYEPRHDQ